jgi:hypothetical protein
MTVYNVYIYICIKIYIYINEGRERERTMLVWRIVRASVRTDIYSRIMTQYTVV